MAELVDALVLGTSDESRGVRVPPPAPSDIMVTLVGEPAVGQGADGKCRDELKLCETNVDKAVGMEAAGLKTRYGHAAISQIGRMPVMAR